MLTTHLREIKQPIPLDGTFRLWLYIASHRRLLLRSTDAEPGHNIDVVFLGVRHMKVRSAYDGLLLREAVEGADMPPEVTGDPADLIVIVDSAGEDYVVCKAVQVSKNSLERFQVEFPVPFRGSESE